MHTRSKHFCVNSSVADAAAVNPNGIKTLLANGLSTFPIKGNPVFSNGPKSLPKSPPDCLVLCNWVFDNFVLANEPFQKFYEALKFVCEKVFSSLESPTTFDEILKVTSVLFFIPYFHLLSCKLDNFTFKVLYWVVL